MASSILNPPFFWDTLYKISFRYCHCGWPSPNDSEKSVRGDWSNFLEPQWITYRPCQRAMIARNNPPIHMLWLSVVESSLGKHLDIPPPSSAAWNTAVLQGHCFDLRLDPFHLESHHANFQPNPLRISQSIQSCASRPFPRGWGNLLIKIPLCGPNPR